MGTKPQSPKHTAVQAALIAPSGMSAPDLFSESLAGLFARPGRMVLTIMGTVIGLAALVATLGLSRTANNRIVGRFDELAATEIVVSASPSAIVPGVQVIPWDAPARLKRLAGVAEVGSLSTVDVGAVTATTSPIKDPSRQTRFNLTVKAASPGLFAAVRADLASGRLLDDGHSARADRVAILGPTAAERLGIVSVERLPAVQIGDDIFLVIGILHGVERQPDLLGAIIIPEGTARDLYRLVGPEVVVIEGAIGATTLIAQQAPIALRPDTNRALRVAFPPEPTRVRDGVQSDLDVLFVMLGGVSLLVGAIGIANVTLVSVIERTGEIGLRRAIGASRRHIASQFLLESSALGLIGGIIGACVGTLVVIAVAAQQQWTPVLDPSLPLVAPAIGTLTGLVSGTYPALRASRLEPVEALRAGT